MTTHGQWFSPRRRGMRDGFTLIEVLASFVVLALLTLAIQRGVVAAASSTSRADMRAGAEAVAASLLDAPLLGPGGAPGPAAGRLNGYDWSLWIDPLPPARFGAGVATTDASPAWVPMRVTVEVREEGRRRIVTSAETVRLVPAAR